MEKNFLCALPAMSTCTFEKKSEMYGRLVGVAVLKDGSLLVAGDGGNMIWRVAAK